MHSPRCTYKLPWPGSCVGQDHRLRPRDSITQFSYAGKDVAKTNRSVYCISMRFLPLLLWIQFPSLTKWWTPWVHVWLGGSTQGISDLVFEEQRRKICFISIAWRWSTILNDISVCWNVVSTPSIFSLNISRGKGPWARWKAAVLLCRNTGPACYLQRQILLPAERGTLVSSSIARDRVAATHSDWGTRKPTLCFKQWAGARANF